MKIVRSETLHSGTKFDLAVHTLRTKSGRELRREFCRHPGAVVVAPMLDDGRIVMVRQFRHAVGAVLLELPAGTLDPGESFEEAASRELREETGFRAGRMQRLASFYPSPGIADETMCLFLATRLTPGERNLEPDEELEVRIVAFDSALAMAQEGAIQDAKTLIGLFRLAQAPAVCE